MMMVMAMMMMIMMMMTMICRASEVHTARNAILYDAVVRIGKGKVGEWWR